jgi:hypothetical protein
MSEHPDFAAIPRAAHRRKLLLKIQIGAPAQPKSRIRRHFVRAAPALDFIAVDRHRFAQFQLTRGAGGGGTPGLQAYVKEYKHCRVPRQYKSPDGYNLGQWVSNRRQRSSIVSPERKAQLAALGFDWKAVE